MEDSRINGRAVSNTTATDMNLPPSCGFWCMVRKRKINNPITRNEESGVRLSRRESLKNENLNDTDSNTTTVTTTPNPHTPKGSCGFWCLARKRQINNSITRNEESAVPLLRRESLKNESLNDTDSNTTAVTTTPNPNTRQGSYCFWCLARKRQIRKTNISEKARMKRQIGSAASEASESA